MLRGKVRRGLGLKGVLLRGMVAGVGVGVGVGVFRCRNGAGGLAGGAHADARAAAGRGVHLSGGKLACWRAPSGKRPSDAPALAWAAASAHYGRAAWSRHVAEPQRVPLAAQGRALATRRRRAVGLGARVHAACAQRSRGVAAWKDTERYPTRRTFRSLALGSRRRRGRRADAEALPTSKPTGGSVGREYRSRGMFLARTEAQLLRSTRWMTSLVTDQLAG